MADNNTCKYHERQSTMKCAIHAVNNMLQEPVYTKESFDQIAKDLFHEEKASKASEIYINPYKNIFGLGNYDVSVIEMAFLRRKLVLKWWDMRKDFVDFDFEKDTLMGFLINYRGEKGFFSDLFKLIQPNHWYSIRKIGGVFYDVDSKLDKPKPFKSFEDLSKRMKDLRKNEGFIFPIYKQE